MKKFLTAVCAALAAVAMAAAFSACTPDDQSETHTHDMTSVAAVEATCTEAGHTAYYECSGCGKYYSDEAGENEISLDDTVIAATGHSMDAVAAKAATCTEAGNTAYYVCDNCGKYFSDEAGNTQITLADTVVAATGHNMDAVAAKAATCTEAGNTAYYVCDDCGKYFSDEAGNTQITLADTAVAATGHKTSAVAAKAATCAQAGNIACYVCDSCGKYFSDAAATSEIAAADVTIPALAHSLTAVAAKEATCAAEGNTAYYVCSACGKLFSDGAGTTEITAADTVVATIPHTLTAVEAKAATCTEAGNAAYYECSVCGKYFADANGATEVTAADTVVPAAGHDMIYVVASSATCTRPGNIGYYLCDTCGNTYSDYDGTQAIDVQSTVVEPVPHTLTLVPEEPATCTEDGHTAYYECSVCGNYFSDAEGQTQIDLEDTVVPAAHSTVTKLVTVAPTATTDGAVNEVCSVCETPLREVVYLPALTDANVDNGTYDYSVTYQSTNGTRFNRYGTYTLAGENETGEDISFSIALGTSINTVGRGSNVSSGSASGSFSRTYLTRNGQSLDEASYGIAITGYTDGWYKFTITSSFDATATLIGSDGSVKDIIVSSDSLEALFEVSTDNYYMIVLHSASTASNVTYTLEETEVPTVSLEESAALPTMAGGNFMVSKASESGGGEAVVLVDQSVVEGEYYIFIDSSAVAQIGRNNRFAVIINGVEYETYLNMSTRRITITGDVSVTLKGGDLITIISANQMTLSNLTFAIEQA